MSESSNNPDDHFILVIVTLIYPDMISGQILVRSRVMCAMCLLILVTEIIVTFMMVIVLIRGIWMGWMSWILYLRSDQYM